MKTTMKTTGKIKVRINGDLNVAIFKEGKLFVAFAPGLDLAAQGKTIPEAQKNFNEVLEIYFEETISKGTLEQDLLRCGWQRNAHSLQPPAFNKFPSPEKLGKDMEIRALTLMPLTPKHLSCPA